MDTLQNITSGVSKEARDWYEQEALTGSWSVRVLQRSVSSDYYHRMLLSQKKDLVKEEMLEITKPRKGIVFISFRGKVLKNKSSKNSSLSKYYSPFNRAKKIYINELGITNDADTKIRTVGSKVAQGKMTTDEAIANLVNA